MDKSDMLSRMIEHYTDGNKAQFALKLGIKPQTISAWIARNTFDAELIYAKCENISAEWLMTGRGMMLLDSHNAYIGTQSSSNPQTGENYVPPTAPTGIIKHEKDEERQPYTTFLLPMSARGGSLTGFAEPGVALENCEKIITPIANVDFAISVHGDSMAPEYPSGSQVLIKKIDPSLFIDWGKVFVLDTPNGVILKEVRYKEGQEGYITCHSLNPDPRYHDFDVPLCEVYGMYRVLMCLAGK